MPDRKMADRKQTTADRKRKHRFTKQTRFPMRTSKKQQETAEISDLEERLNTVTSDVIHKFTDMPLSRHTQRGLAEAGYTTPTDIQREATLLGLQGNDVLGAARTGSGKTLAFLLPALERLYRRRWSSIDGLGVLIVTPTRELAYQIFEVLRKVGRLHDFSAGLVIGGKNLKEEARSINHTNIVICTPGRMLQHLDETVNFHADNLQLLVLDEADRILDLGFSTTMNAIIQSLPADRQTLLFSATQTRSVQDLARLSLRSPVYVSVHEKAQKTPVQLTQSAVLCPLEDKVTLLWSFVKHHLRKKTLVFLSCCKQVRYIHECFRKLRPGVPVLGLHGAMPQMKRMHMYEEFCRKQHAVLFATDIASRGLDFPAVDWVLQLDCPDDVSTYIHRVGRTARYEANGEALLVLTPSEEHMLTELRAKRIPIELIQLNPKKQWSVQGKLAAFCAADVQHKEFAQRAVVTYLKTIHLRHNKQVFDVTKYDIEKFAESLGLAMAPRLKFLVSKPKAGAPRKKFNSEKYADIDGNDDVVNKLEKKKKGKIKDKKAVAEEKKALVAAEEEEDDLLTVRKVIHPDEDAEGNKEKLAKKVTKSKLAQKLLRKNIKVNKVTTWDDEGQVVVDPMKQSVVDDDVTDEEEHGLDLEAAAARMRREDEVDKEMHRARVREHHRERRRKEKERERMRKGLPARTAAELEPDEEDDGEYVPFDPDTLPDPDRIYGPEKEADDVSGDAHSEGDSDADVGEYPSDDDVTSDEDSPAVKRQRIPEVATSESESEADLCESEAIAMRLLQG